MGKIEGIPVIRATHTGVSAQPAPQKVAPKAPGISTMLAGNTTNTNAPSFTSSVSTPTQTSTAASVKSEKEKAPAKCTQYTIQKGDTLSSIAKRFGCSLGVLSQMNPSINANKLKIKQKILVPANLHTIKAGETLSKIANDEKVELERVKTANPQIKPKKLRIGQNIFIPMSASEAGIKNQNAKSKTFGLNAKSSAQTSPISAEKKASIINSSQEFIKGFEGSSNVTYTCPAGATTIGYGHQIKKGENFSNGIDEATALRLLKEDTTDAYNKVINALGNKAGDLSEEQIGALDDLVFNAGAHPKCIKLIKEGKFDEAQKEMNSVNVTIRDKDGKPIRKEVLSGLIIRRAKDMALLGDGKISSQGQKVLLEKLNKRLKTKYKTLQEAETKIKNEIAALSKSNRNPDKLKILNNLMPLFNVINNPQSVVDSF